jgi:hypothetical protein
LSDVRHGEAMNEKPRIDVDALMLEIARYLAAIDAFRAAECQPTWLPEPTVQRA